VAGPALWTDLYGEWIDDAEVVTTFRGGDARVVAAAARTIRDAAHDLVVVHLGACDDLAHRHGARSEAYRAGLREYDRAVGLLADAADADTAVIVTTDHGVATGGGHAGPEPDVLRTPFIAVGPGFPPQELGVFPQRDVARIVATALGARLELSGPGPAVMGSAALVVVVALGLPAAAIILSRVAAGAAVAREAILLDAALWTSILLGALASPMAGLAIAAGALVVAALRRGGGPARPRPVAAWISLGGALVAARLGGEHLALAGSAVGWRTGTTMALGVVAGLSLVWARRGAGAPSDANALARTGGIRGVGFPAIAGLLAFMATCAVIGGGALVAIALVALALGRLLGATLRRSAPGAGAAVGAALACIAVLLPGLLGESVSLSTIDVRAAVLAVDLPLGLALAILVVMLRHAATTLALLGGLSPSLRSVPPERLGGLVAGAAAVCLGEALAAGAALNWSAGSVTVGSLALGSLVRVVAEVTSLFLGAAAVVAAGARRAGQNQRGTKR
jgi:hypothetical protein